MSELSYLCKVTLLLLIVIIDGDLVSISYCYTSYCNRQHQQTERIIPLDTIILSLPVYLCVCVSCCCCPTSNNNGHGYRQQKKQKNIGLRWMSSYNGSFSVVAFFSCCPIVDDNCRYNSLTILSLLLLLHCITSSLLVIFSLPHF